jgi:hypothetical protein
MENWQWCGEPRFAGAVISLDGYLPRIPRRQFELTNEVSLFPGGPEVLVIYSLGADPTENIAFNSSAIVVMGACPAIARILLTCLPAVTKQQFSRDLCIATILHCTSLLSLHES